MKSIKAFTLIELMIVIAIIGILAITIIPQLTGAQARARDTGRISNVATSRAVLETYFGDEGSFPQAVNGGCLSQSGGSFPNTHSDLAALFNKGKAPTDPQAKNKSRPCKIGGVIGYKPLEKYGTQDNSYLIVTNVEMLKKANTYLSGATATGYSSYENLVGSGISDTHKKDDAGIVYAELY